MTPYQRAKLILKRCQDNPNAIGDLLIEGIEAAEADATKAAEEILDEKNKEIEALKIEIVRWQDSNQR